jgi:uncharacterized protein YbjT (DUF2867 family)
MIVVTTPTGHIGNQVLNKILGSTDEPVRVIARDPSRLPPNIKSRAGVVEGSTDDADVVNRAFVDADVVLWIVPGDDKTQDLKAHYQKFNEIAADAINKQGVKKCVWVSTLGEEVSEPSGHLGAALAADAVLEDTGVDARILAPATFMDNLLWQAQPLNTQGKFFLANGADTVLNNVATSDIADAASNFLLRRDWQGQERVPLIGPDDLTPNQMAEVMSGILGKEIVYQQLDPQVFKQNMEKLGNSNAVAQGLMEMAMAVNAGAYRREAETSSRTATSFRQWCESALKPAILS